MIDIEKILKSMKVMYPSKVFRILSSETFDIAKYFHGKIIYSGGGTEISEFEYRGTVFNFYKIQTKQSVKYHLYPNDDDERHDYCIFIIVDFEEKIIRLDTIAYNEKCFTISHHKNFGKLKVVVEPSPTPNVVPMIAYKALYVVLEIGFPLHINQPVGAVELTQAIIMPAGNILRVVVGLIFTPPLNVLAPPTVNVLFIVLAPPTVNVLFIVLAPPTVTVPLNVLLPPTLSAPFTV
jgi:hypothetical protein